MQVNTFTAGYVLDKLVTQYLKEFQFADNVVDRQEFISSFINFARTNIDTHLETASDENVIKFVKETFIDALVRDTESVTVCDSQRDPHGIICPLVLTPQGPMIGGPDPVYLKHLPFNILTKIVTEGRIYRDQIPINLRKEDNK